jgi:hypothetical protein
VKRACVLSDSGLIFAVEPELQQRARFRARFCRERIESVECGERRSEVIATQRRDEPLLEFHWV